MSFAIFYNETDLPLLTSAWQAAKLAGQDRTYAGSIWNGGLSGWANAPIAPLALQFGDPDTRMIILTSGTKAQLIAFLYKYATQTGCAYLAVFADDMATSAVEPSP